MTTEISRRSLLRGIGAASLAIPTGVFLAGCGSDDDEGSGATTGSSGTDTGSSDTDTGSSDTETGGSGATSGSSGTDTGSSSSGAEPALLTRGKKQGYLTVAIANEPPYTKVEADGTVTGCAPDVFRAVVKSMGVPDIKGKTVAYDTMISGLKADHWDAITAGLFMKQSRCAAVDYSGPVIVSTESFAVPKGNPKNLTKISDIANNPDIKVVALPGAFEETALKSGGVPESQIVGINNNRSGVEAVINGRADAFMLPTLSLQALQEGEKDFDITDPIPDAPRTGSGAAFRKSDDDFVKLYDEHLQQLKDSGEFAKIVKKWGFPVEPALEATVEELCKAPG